MTDGHDRAMGACDVALAVMLFIFTLPLQSASALAIRVRLGHPVLFKRVRPGLRGVPFEIVKFRTTPDVDPELDQISHASRMTPLGHGSCLPSSTRLDMHYVDHHTLSGELKILLATVTSVLKRDGTSLAGAATRPEFLGTYSQQASA